MSDKNRREEGFIGKGTIYVDLGDGLFELGNASKFETKVEYETRQRISHKRDNWGSVLDTVSIPKSGELTIEIDTLNHKNLALALMGKLDSGKLTAETIIDEIVIVKDGWLKLNKKWIDTSQAITVTDELGTQTINREDIKINDRLGLIMISEEALIGAGIDKGEKIKVSYKTATVERALIQAGTEVVLKGALMFDGKNLVTNESVVVNMPKFTMTAENAFDFFSDDFQKVTFKGSPEIADGEQAPYTVEIKSKS